VKVDRTRHGKKSPTSISRLLKSQMGSRSYRGITDAFKQKTELERESGLREWGSQGQEMGNWVMCLVICRPVLTDFVGWQLLWGIFSVLMDDFGSFGDAVDI
jgi:hypothetical protein